jgi:hypothetical protein
MYSRHSLRAHYRNAQAAVVAYDRHPALGAYRGAGRDGPDV